MASSRIAQPEQWNAIVRRYAAGEYRARVCADLIRSDIGPEDRPRILDIGCGRGFFDDPGIQRSLAACAGEYVGVEPDTAIQSGEWVSHVYPEVLEQAPIPPASIDLALCAMVLEHLDQPERFFAKLLEILRPDGIFWGFTVDKRHWFAYASLAAHSLGIKRNYLDKVNGRPGEDRYENYDVVYAANTPADLRRLTREFSRCDILNLSQPGQIDFYFPRGLRWVGRALDGAGKIAGMPGPLLAVRLVR